MGSNDVKSSRGAISGAMRVMIYLARDSVAADKPAISVDQTLERRAPGTHERDRGISKQRRVPK